jgi:hypothetical protein
VWFKVEQARLFLPSSSETYGRESGPDTLDAYHGDMEAIAKALRVDIVELARREGAVSRCPGGKATLRDLYVLDGLWSERYDCSGY